eukprot:TRINITY_DN10563_c0_g1_i5.p4 TRINITY_DN10563_c0_g1~~TRINITY_DN10563_c0_g1_i5.p4  ORF type:complete len:129 (+),score=16.99 TRINITY_DN10563_c0_g1_i5:235-621(+)
MDKVQGWDLDKLTVPELMVNIQITDTNQFQLVKSEKKTLNEVCRSLQCQLYQMNHQAMIQIRIPVPTPIRIQAMIRIIQKIGGKNSAGNRNEGKRREGDKTKARSQRIPVIEGIERAAVKRIKQDQKQ